MKPNYKLILILAGCVIYVFLRFWRLTDSCLWCDEIFSIQAAEMGWHAMFWFVAQDLIHPPLFYIFLKIWISIGGESLFWLRFFPVFFSSISLIPFYFLCRQLKLSTTSFATAFLLFAVNGNLIKYAQEVRMYSVLLCLALFSLWLFARYLNSGKGIWFLTIINIFLVHTQYFGWLLVAVEILVLIYFQRVRIGQLMVSVGMTFVSAIPWAIIVLQASRLNSNVAQNLSWARKPDFETTAGFFVNLNEPIYFQTSNIDPISMWQVMFPIFLVLFTSIAAYFVNWKSRDENERKYLLILTFITFSPILLAFIVSWILPLSIWGTRHLIIVFGPYSILIAKIIGGVQMRGLKFGLIAALIFAVGGAIVIRANQRIEPPLWCAWEDFARPLSSTAEGPEQATNLRIYTFEDLVAYHFWFFLRHSDRDLQIYKVRSVEGIHEDKAYFLPRGFSEIITIDESAIEGERFFIAFSSVAWDQNNSPLKNLIERGYKIGTPKTFRTDHISAFMVEVHR